MNQWASPQVLKQLLVEPGIISEKDFLRLEKKSEQSEGEKSLYDLILKEGYAKDEDLGRLVAEEQGYGFFDSGKEHIDDEILLKIPELMAREKKIAAIRKIEEGVKVAMMNPDDKKLRYTLEKLFNDRVIPVATTPKNLDSAHSRYQVNLTHKFDQMISRAMNPQTSSKEHYTVVKTIVDLIIERAYENRASDIHFDPYNEFIQVRFRIDGILSKIVKIDKKFYNSILSRVKILSNMRIDEHRAAQDGKFHFVTSEKQDIDVRVSIVPTPKGEDIVMRLLTGGNRQYKISDISLSEDDRKKIEEAIHHPHGMILVTGPTGSGKTTTLYAIMQERNEPSINIATIEEPVEYAIEGITQIQVNQKTNLTFAKGLRAIVRQDPDIIMVGEIRDQETAGIAVNAALTGHLFFTTLHTNDAPTTLPRLLDMKLKPFLVASTVNVIISQRLVRKICDSCVSSYTPGTDEKEIIKMNKEILKKLGKSGEASLSTIRLYKGTGCNVCAQTGYNGRLGIFEVLEMNDKISKAIMDNENADNIRVLAREAGMTTMLEDGLLKSLKGLTTISEVLRLNLWK